MNAITEKFIEMDMLSRIFQSLSQQLAIAAHELKKPGMQHDIELNLNIQRIENDLSIIEKPMAEVSLAVYDHIENKYGGGKKFKFLKKDATPQGKNGSNMSIT